MWRSLQPRPLVARHGGLDKNENFINRLGGANPPAQICSTPQNVRQLWVEGSVVPTEIGICRLCASPPLLAVIVTVAGPGAAVELALLPCFVNIVKHFLYYLDKLPANSYAKGKESDNG